jgi:hypothetical protein
MMARSGVGTASRLLAACTIVAACNSAQPVAAPDPGVPYLDDASYRRSDLVTSLVNPANSYSAIRLAHYATGNQDDWDLLPEWNPPAEPITRGWPTGPSPWRSRARPATLARGADGALAPGLPDHELKIGAAILDAPGSSLDAVTASAIAAWGPGRLDVTTTAGTEPARIPDLRPVRWLTYLQQDATVRVVDRTTLATRIAPKRRCRRFGRSETWCARRVIALR